MLVDETAGSGGDLLPYMFKRRKIGPLVGKRTWGGLVHTADTPGFIDGGSMIAPRGGFFTRDGRWAVENEGVGPDIDVENWPKEVIAGAIRTERAVEEAMKLLKSHPANCMTTAAAAGMGKTQGDNYVAERPDVPMEEPQAALERAFIDEYLRTHDHDLLSVYALPADQRRDILRDAALYALHGLRNWKPGRTTFTKSTAPPLAIKG
jgi:hypothetical protein